MNYLIESTADAFRALDKMEDFISDSPHTPDDDPQYVEDDYEPDDFDAEQRAEERREELNRTLREIARL